MKNIDRLKDELKRTQHKNCVLHFIAESKKKACLICVKPAMTSVYSKGDQIIMFGLKDDSVFKAVVGIKDLYMLLLGEITIPHRMRIKEVIYDGVA